MCKKMPVSYTNFEKKSPYRGRGKPSLGRFATLALPPLTNLGCTTVTGIAKMHKGAMPPPPIDRRVKQKKKERKKGKCFPETNSLGKE